MRISLYRRIALALAAVALAAGSTVALPAQASMLPAPNASTVPATGDALQESEQGWIGVVIATLTERLADRLGLSQKSGVLILDVIKDSPAAQAGLQDRDVIIKVGDGDIANAAVLREALADRKPGDTLDFTVVRKGQEGSKTLTVTLGQRRSAPRHDQHSDALLGRVLDQIPELRGITAGERFSHLFSGQLRLADKDGHPITITATAGTIKRVSGRNLTLDPNGLRGNRTYGISDATTVVGKDGKVNRLEAGDQVVVITLNGSHRARYILLVASQMDESEG